MLKNKASSEHISEILLSRNYLHFTGPMGLGRSIEPVLASASGGPLVPIKSRQTRKTVANNLIQNQLRSHLIRPAQAPYVSMAPGANGTRTALMLKTLFIGVVVIVFALINPAIFYSAKPVASSEVNLSPTETQPISVVKASTTPNPNFLSIPSLNINAPFEFLGLNANQTIEVPKNDMSVGWFVYGAKPGEIGAAVIVGHLDSIKGNAIFANLNKIKTGDEIKISREDGSEVIYVTDSVSKFSQNNFPTHKVYDSTPYPSLRLITCAGTYNKQAGHYSDNLVVFGRIK